MEGNPERENGSGNGQQCTGSSQWILTHNAWQDCRTKFLKVSRRVFCPENREIDRDEYKRLVKCAYKRGDERMAMLLQTICATGIRVSEVPYITIEAVKQGKAEVECKGRIRTVF